MKTLIDTGTAFPSGWAPKDQPAADAVKEFLNAAAASHQDGCHLLELWGDGPNLEHRPSPAPTNMLLLLQPGDLLVIAPHQTGEPLAHIRYQRASDLDYGSIVAIVTTTPNTSGGYLLEEVSVATRLLTMPDQAPGRTLNL